MPQAEPASTTILAFPTSRKRAYQNPRVALADLPENCAHIGLERVKRGLSDPPERPEFPVNLFITAVLDVMGPDARVQVWKALERQRGQTDALDARVDAATYWMAMLPFEGRG